MIKIILRRIWLRLLVSLLVVTIICLLVSLSDDSTILSNIVYPILTAVLVSIITETLIKVYEIYGQHQMFKGIVGDYKCRSFKVAAPDIYPEGQDPLDTYDNGSRVMITYIGGNQLAFKLHEKNQNTWEGTLFMDNKVHGRLPFSYTQLSNHSGPEVLGGVKDVIVTKVEGDILNILLLPQGQSGFGKELLVKQPSIRK